MKCHRHVLFAHVLGPTEEEKREMERKALEEKVNDIYKFLAIS